MKQDAAIIGLSTGAVIAVAVVAIFNYWLGRESLRPELAGLRAQVAALRAADGDASCAVMRNGPRVLCALRGTGKEIRLQHTALGDGDVVCAVQDRWSGRAICRLADGRQVTLRRVR